MAEKEQTHTRIYKEDNSKLTKISVATKRTKPMTLSIIIDQAFKKFKTKE
jgi:hypothetical protein